MNNRIILIETLIERDMRPGMFTRGNSLEPYALECLAAVVEQQGYDIEILQPGEKPIDELVSLVLKRNPFCVGLSVWTHTSTYARELAQNIKSILPKCVIVVGGQHPSLVPSYVIEKAFDYAVLGEGEETFSELLDFLSGKRFSQAEDIKGIAFKNIEGKLIQTEPRPRIQNLDALPLPKRVPEYLKSARSWNLTYPSPSKQIAVAQVSYSRGCRYRCTFCVSPPVWSGNHGMLTPSRSISYRSPSSVAKEVRNLHDNYGVNFLYFTDLTFNDDPLRVRDLCKAFIDEGLHESMENSSLHLKHSVHWFALLKVGLDDETAQLMAKAGCSKIGMGIESFDTAQVHAYKKPYRGTEILETSLRAADNAGIINRCLLIIGAPDETNESIQKTIDGIKRYPVDQIRVAFLTPYPNTPIFHQLAEHLCTHDLDYYDEEHPIVKGRFLSREELYAARVRIAWELYGSSEYSEHCQQKLQRFPWLRDSYSWFFDDIYSRSLGRIDLRPLTSSLSNQRKVAA